MRLRDIARIELGAQHYVSKGYLGEYPVVASPVYQQPGSNALTTAEDVIEEMRKISKDFPPRSHL